MLWMCVGSAFASWLILGVLLKTSWVKIFLDAPDRRKMHQRLVPRMGGLGMLAGPVRRFSGPAMTTLKVPHMGWNTVQQTRPHPLWHGIADCSRFYFVHSYHVVPADPRMMAGQTDYGIPFTSAVVQDNIFGIQCHPEKSARSGLALLANFIQWKP